MDSAELGVAGVSGRELSKPNVGSGSLNGRPSCGEPFGPLGVGTVRPVLVEHRIVDEKRVVVHRVTFPAAWAAVVPNRGVFLDVEASRSIVVPFNSRGVRLS